jgi:hypothetical protein
MPKRETRIVHRENGDRIIVFPGHGLPDHAFYPEHLKIVKENWSNRHTAVVFHEKKEFGRFVVKEVNPGGYAVPTHNSLFTEARLLLEAANRGVKVEKPLAIYVSRNGGLPKLFTQYVEGVHPNQVTDEMVGEYSRARAEAESKNVFLLDSNQTNNYIFTGDEEPVTFIDLEHALLPHNEEGKLKRGKRSPGFGLDSKPQKISEWVNRVRREFINKKGV